MPARAVETEKDAVGHRGPSGIGGGAVWGRTTRNILRIIRQARSGQGERRSVSGELETKGRFHTAVNYQAEGCDDETYPRKLCFQQESLQPEASEEGRAKTSLMHV